MEKIILKMFILLLFSMMGCEPEEEPINTGRILAVTCGGTVVQFLNISYGEAWTDHFTDPEHYESYKNVVLTGSLTKNDVKNGDTIYFDFKEVDHLKGFWCAIGGLPSTTIKISNLSH